MKQISLLIAIIVGTGSCPLYSQGWVAKVDLNFTHDLYAYENIANATMTYSGVTVTGSSETGHLQLVINGTGSISGAIDLIIAGTAWEPYESTDPFSAPLSAEYSGQYSAPCEKGFFEHPGATPQEHIYIWINVYPRLEITDFVQECDTLTLRSDSCSPAYVWEVGSQLAGGFKVIAGKSTSSITITRDELVTLGFTDPFGRKYFRVTGLQGTTSQLQAVDIYYPGPSALLTITSPKCHSGTDGSIGVEITGAIPAIDDFVITLFGDIPPANPLQQHVLNNIASLNLRDLAAGNYWVRIENNSTIATYGSCWTDLAVPPLVNPEELNITFESSDHNGYPITCNGENDGTLTAIPDGGTNTFKTYEWTPDVAPAEQAEYLAAGTYQVRVQDSNDCWSDTFTKELDEPERLSMTLVSTGGKNGFDVSCYDKQDGVVETTITGGVGGYVYAWSNGTTDPVLRNAPPGSYEVTTIDANGCSAAATIELQAPEHIDFSIAEVVPITCPGERSGALGIQSITNTIGSIYYSWSSGESVQAISNKPSGVYSAIVSDDQGCDAVRQHTLVEPDAYEVNIVALSDYNGSPVRCSGDASGELEAIVTNNANMIVRADHYVWYKNNTEITTGSGVSAVSDLTAGTYRVEATYRDVCKTEKTFVLQEPDPIVAGIIKTSDFNGFPISCHGGSDGSITVTAKGGTGDSYHYAWAHGETGPGLSGLPAGAYSLTMQDINGCVGHAQIILEEPKPVKAHIDVLSNFNGQAISCTNLSDGQLRGSASGGTGIFTFSWNTRHTGSDLLHIPAGEYILTATDANGCRGNADTTIANPTPVTAIVAGVSDYHGFAVSCNGSADGFLRFDANGGAGGYVYRWAHSEHEKPFMEQLLAGTYTLTAEDRNGCEGSAQATLTEPSVVTVGVDTFKDVSCHAGNDGEIQLLATGGAGNFEYSHGEENWQATPLFAALKAGDYRLLARDINGCSASTPQTLREPPPLDIHFHDLEPALCGDPRGKVSAKVSGGTGEYRYRWTDTENEPVGDAPSISGLQAGTFTLHVLDANNCPVRESVGVTSADGPGVTVTSINHATCSYSTDGSAMLDVTGTGPFSFLWENGQRSAEATHLPKGDHLVSVTDANSCTVVETVTVLAPDSLVAQLIERDDVSCHGLCDGRLKILATGGNGNYTYEWSDMTGPEAANLCAGEYKISITDENGCLALNVFALPGPDPIVVRSLAETAPICPGGCDGKLETGASGGTGDLVYQWSNAGQGPSLSNLCPGAYSVTVTDENYCSATKDFTLENPTGQALELGASTILCTGQSHLLDPEGVWTQYMWGSNNGFTSSQPSIEIFHAGLYWLEATTIQGCITRDTFLLETSSDLLDANFLLATEAMVGDTVVMIDVSWPLPESIEWHLPAELDRLEHLGDIVYGKFKTPGNYEVSLSAKLEACRDKITKYIVVLNGEEISDEGRLGSERLLKNYSLYPNPNDGVFEVEIEFREESPLVLTIWNTLTATKIAQAKDRGSSSYRIPFNLRPLSAGTYSIRLDHPEGRKYLRFIVR